MYCCHLLCCRSVGGKAAGLPLSFLQKSLGRLRMLRSKGVCQLDLENVAHLIVQLNACKSANSVAIEAIFKGFGHKLPIAAYLSRHYT